MTTLSHLRPHFRRISLLLWAPMAVIVFVCLSFVFSVRAQSPQTFVSGGVSTTMFAVAPPKGQVLGDSIAASADVRTEILHKYLKAYKSPLADHAGTFITVADKYDLDWRLLPALAGVESGFGNAMPKNSYNAWGWGVPTGSQTGTGFSSWDEAIEVVGKGLYKGYFSQGYHSLRDIEERYAPPSADDPNHPWLTNLQKYMAEIE